MRIAVRDRELSLRPRRRAAMLDGMSADLLRWAGGHGPECETDLPHSALTRDPQCSSHEAITKSRLCHLSCRIADDGGRLLDDGVAVGEAVEIPCSGGHDHGDYHGGRFVLRAGGRGDAPCALKGPRVSPGQELGR